ncbi:hypothetical protein Cs7R123_52070 [Catellatospora sp. TT07R-123]|uniref:hypothetical protein n=1 Tax=Catellatospora sp. TT07R-123 TaxID=2733863 RepID=UPI001B2BC850|nr:hypothetical protein [Catellatospora sp. TT07R-123]GHJ47865.1 hypothetical protein Cs7R123_52070 [Catellatospora sp. TT07R-123]
MRTHALPRAAAALLAALLTALGGAAPAAAATAAARLGTTVLHQLNTEFGPTRAPRLFTAACGPGEELVSGGWAGFSPFVEVLGSYPSDEQGQPVPAGARPTAWTVAVANLGKEVQRLQVTAACLTGGEGRGSAAAATETRADQVFALAVACPDGTVRTGGGFRSEWTPQLGGAAVHGSFPSGDTDWTLDVRLTPGDPDVKARATVTAYAVCLAGPKARAETVLVDLGLDKAAQVCTGGDLIFAPTCVVPRSGTAGATCPADLTLTGGGYQLLEGDLPGDTAVQVATLLDPVARRGWTVAVRGDAPTDAPITVRISAVCVSAAPEPVPATGDPAITLPNRTGLDLPPLIGLGVLLLLLLAALALWRLLRRDRTRPAAGVSVEVVVRSGRSGYRLDGFRESL